MKKIFLLFVVAAVVLSGGSCSKSFLNVAPQGNALTADKFYNAAGVQQLLVGAYHDLTGMDVKSTWWSSAGSNWIWGDITSGDTYVGGTGGGGLPAGIPDALNIQNYQELPTTSFVDAKWTADYDGVARANAVILAVQNAKDMTDPQKNETIAEARFLRGHF